MTIGPEFIAGFVIGVVFSLGVIALLSAGYAVGKQDKANKQ